MNKYRVWKNENVSAQYLQGIRAALPLMEEQIYFVGKLIQENGGTVNRFLDLGCGDGILGAHVFELYPQATGIFLDISEAMLKQAKEKLSNYKGPKSFHLKDFSTQEWIDSVSTWAPFEVVVSGFAIHHLEDEKKRKVYQQVFELLKPGGIFINLEHVAPSNKWAEELFEKTIIEKLITQKKESSNPKSDKEIEEDFRNRQDKEANILSPVDIQCEWLKEIGFQDVDCYFKIFDLAILCGRKA